MDSIKIQISIKLLEKLAGVKRDEGTPQRRQQLQQQQLQQQRTPLGPPGLGALLPGGPDLAAGSPGLDPELRGALAASRRVGSLLLKAEEQEMARVAEAAEELIRREYSVPIREVPCVHERDACVGCYQRHKQDAWQCASLVDAYFSCAAAAYDDVTSS